MNAVLFATVCLCWGLTWYAIHLQIGPVPDTVSVFWRFAVAAGCLWVLLAVSGRLRRVSWRRHGWFVVLGLTLFSINFVLLYGAEHDLPSGVVSIVFSLATIFTALNHWLFDGVRPSRRVLAGAVIGSAGVAALFGTQLTTPGGAHVLRGLAFVLGGTCLFSLGNLAARRATADGVTLANAMVRGMAWGAAVLAVIALVRGHDLRVAPTAPWFGGMIYLALMGSVVGFLAYLTLVARIGPARAAYVTVIAPLIALSVSTVLEDYRWSAAALLGVPMILGGSMVVFMPVAWLRRLGRSAVQPAVCD